MGLGGMDASSPLFMGMLGMHGTVYSNRAVDEADLLIAIGARFDDRVTGNTEKFAPKAKVIHIDVDPGSISKNIHVEVPIVGDVKEVLKELTQLCDKLDTAECMQQASRHVLARRREAGESTHPFYWGAFIASGDWR